MIFCFFLTLNKIFIDILTSGVSFCHPHDCEAQVAVADHVIELTGETDPIIGQSATPKIIHQAIRMDFHYY